MLRSISDGGGCLFWFADSKDVYVQSRCSPVPVGVVQDLSPSRVVAASTGHARAVVVTTTHLPMAMAGPWTVCVYPLMDGVTLTSYGVTPQRGSWMRARYG